MSLIDVDGVRRSDLGVGGWLGVGAVAGGLAYAGEAVLYTADDPATQIFLGVVVAILGAAIAYQNGAAEVESRCKSCGTEVRVHSGRAGTDEAVLVRGSDTPRRVRIGPISAVVSRDRYEAVYCDGECADSDDRIEFRAVDPEPASARTDVAADGGSDR